MPSIPSAALMAAPAIAAAMQQENDRQDAMREEADKEREAAREQAKQMLSGDKRKAPTLRRKPIDVLSNFCDW